MSTPAELEAQLLVDQQALAAADLAILQAFQAQMAGGTFTVAAFTAAFGALAGQVGDTSRQAQINNFFGQFEATLTAFAAMVDATARDAAPPAAEQ